MNIVVQSAFAFLPIVFTVIIEGPQFFIWVEPVPASDLATMWRIESPAINRLLLVAPGPKRLGSRAKQCCARCPGKIKREDQARHADT